ncbi:MAG: DNA translocase FtsK 4TM domain-containing protein, partial [candidate division KSB1 bacterium]|nr:DNA translocase FtsK 4TM domain-containing protein [candidate division KSB1 bacterium]
MRVYRLEEELRPMVLTKACQVAGVFLLMGVLFLMLCVSSYTPGDPTGNYYVSHGDVAIQNRGGPVGAALADWALQAFGSAVYGLAGLAVLAAWHLMRGRVAAVAAVAWRGLLCLAAGSAVTYLLFTRDPFFGTAMFVGGFLADLAVAYLSRPGAYAVLSLAALGALCVGGRHPVRTALWRGLRATGHGSQRLVRAVRCACAGVGRRVRQGRAVASRLGQWGTRRRRSDVTLHSHVPSPAIPQAPPPDNTSSPALHAVPPPALHAPPEPYAPPAAALPPVLCQEGTAVTSVDVATPQRSAASAPPPAVPRRQRQPVVSVPPAVRRPPPLRAAPRLP